MKKSNNKLVTQAPVSAFSKPLKFDIAGIFKGLSKAVVHFGTGKHWELASDAVEIGTALGLKSKLEESAFTLIKLALYEAGLELAKESERHFEFLADQPEESLALSSAVESKLANLSISLDREFFRKPEKMSFLADVTPIYQQWLVDMRVSPQAAQTIAARLPSYFVYALSNEWRKNASSYQALVDALDTPFSNADERLKDWENYRSLLQKRVDENVFDEPFSLRQIYVPLRAYYVKHLDKEECRETGREQRQEKVVIELAAELSDWLNARQKSDAIRVLSGGPGSGKSSFTKIFCADIFQQGLAKPIYIPLHLIDPARDIAEQVCKFVNSESSLRFNPLDTAIQESDLLIVFDGLDELASQGKAAAQVAREFVSAVERMVETHNRGKNTLLVLISGRELIVQENEPQFRRTKQILTLLPYFTNGNERGGYTDPQQLLTQDARNAWWQNYGKLTGKEFSSLPENLKNHEIDEITAQPLLNYLVALSFSRGKINFSDSLNLNDVYADLVDAVYERGYEGNNGGKGRVHSSIQHIKKDEFLRVLEEVAK